MPRVREDGSGVGPSVGRAVGMAPHDARNSPGFDPARLSGARLDRLKACAAKAAATFPPPYTHQPYEGPLSTEAGDRMLQRGRWANAHRAKAPKDSGSTGHFGPGWPTAAELDSELGGPDGFFTLCGLHYCNLFANPRMVTLFDTRDADDDMADILEDEMGKGAFPGVLHCFSSGRRLAERALDIGFYISLSGIVTFKNASEIQECAKSCPVNSFMIETDAPYLAPVPFRGKRCEPSHAMTTAQFIADLRETSIESLSEKTSSIADSFFQF